LQVVFFGFFKAGFYSKALFDVYQSAAGEIEVVDREIKEESLLLPSCIRGALFTAQDPRRGR
jgi:hypothetical protein